MQLRPAAGRLAWRDRTGIQQQTAFGLSIGAIHRRLQTATMSPSNLSVVEIKAFVPARDFGESIRFYEALGFTCASVFEGIAYLRCGESSFLLQDFFAAEFAANFQMHLLVEDVDAWHALALTVAARFEVRIGEPEDQPWAMRDFTLFDPSGVLWRIAQNIPRASAA